MRKKDGDKVEESNLNRQNYVKADIGNYKAEILCKRLLEINPNAEIKILHTFIDKENVEDIIPGHHIAINPLVGKSNRRISPRNRHLATSATFRSLMDCCRALRECHVQSDNRTGSQILP